MAEKGRMINNYDILYLFGGDTDNHFVRQMIEKGCTPTKDSNAFPRFLINGDAREIYFDKNKEDRVGKFSCLGVWKNLMNQKRAISKEPLAKAIGLKNLAEGKNIVDMSCGTGKDTLLLLNFGFKVSAYERNEIIYTLLDYYFSLLENEKSFPKERFKLSYGNPAVLELPFNPDVFYFDPMYGVEANKKAAPRAQMAMFRNFVGVDLDFEDCLKKAFGLARNRVVLKRPSKSKVLLPESFSHSIHGKSTRYDVYLTGG